MGSIPIPAFKSFKSRELCLILDRATVAFVGLADKLRVEREVLIGAVLEFNTDVPAGVWHAWNVRFDLREMDTRLKKLMSEVKRWCDHERGRQTELAKRFGVSRQVFSYWLSLKRDPPAGVALELLAFWRSRRKPSPNEPAACLSVVILFFAP
jgi:hypothetical protein